MNNQDWEHFGEEIRRTVQDAVDSQDFRKLNQTISNTINQAIGTAARSFGDAMDRTAQNMGKRGGYQANTNQSTSRGYGSNTGYSYQSEGRYKGYAAQTVRTENQPVLYKPSSGVKAGGIVLCAFGYGVGGIMFLLFLIFLIAGIAMRDFGIGFQITIAVFGILTAGFAVMARVGSTLLGKVRRFRNYVRRIAGREYCNIRELADDIHKSTVFVTKDVERMIESGWFRQGHLDRKKSCLIVTGRAYEEYLRLEERIEAQRQEEMQQAEKEEPQSHKKQETDVSPEVQKVLDQGKAYIQKIRACNDAIPGEEISGKIARIEMLVERIFARVEQNPESINDIRKLLEYYLPTTVKLLEAYEEMDRQPVGGENIQTAKREIEATLDTLNTAFEKLLDDLFQDTAWDISSDISVLNTILAQEGLKEDGLKR